MPGVIGYITKNKKDPAELKLLAEKMANFIKHQDEHIIDIMDIVEGKAFWGQVALNFMEKERELKQYDDNECSVLLWGTVYNEKNLISGCEHREKSGIGELIAFCYKKFGQDFIYKLNGDFIILIFDKRENKVIILNDRMGTYPLYFQISTENLIFASELKALFATHEIRNQLDYCAIADYFSFSAIMNNRTFLSDIKLLPPSTILTYNLVSGKTETKCYWDVLNNFGSKTGDKSEIYEELRHAFNNAVSKRLDGDTRLGLALSGGLDTRAILSAIDTDKYPLLTYTLGVPGCRDERIARQLSSIKKTRHTFANIDNNYIANYLENARTMVFLTDGFYPPFEFTEMMAYNELRKENFHILIRGHGGELAKSSLAWPFQVNRNVMELKQYNGDYLKKILIEEGSFVKKSIKWKGRFNRHYETVDWKPVFREEIYLKIKDAAYTSLDSMLSKVNGNLHPADICTYFYMHVESGRRTASALSIFRNQVEVRMPFLDSDFVRNLLNVHYSYRNTTDLHKYIISRNSPELMKIPDSNTGAPLTAGHFRISMIEKFTTLMKRLNIKGYLHYQNFHDWIRMKMGDIEGVLLDQRTLERGIYNADGIKTIIHQHMNEGYDHGYMIGSLLGLELWFRMFIDGNYLYK